MSELPVVDERRCTACGDCVEVCPTQCLALGESLPWIRRPRDCIACALCVLLCPEDALSMREEAGESPG